MIMRIKTLLNIYYNYINSHPFLTLSIMVLSIAFQQLYRLIQYKIMFFCGINKKCKHKRQIVVTNGKIYR